MGNPVGVFTDKEVQDLNNDERELLKEHVVHHFVTCQEIRDILNAEPTLLPTLLQKYPKIREILRDRADALRQRLQQK